MLRCAAMRSEARGKGQAAFAAFLFLALLLLQAWPSLSLKSPTFDEPAHIAAGMSYLETREFLLNPQHPPLLKEIAAVPLLLAGVEWPVGPAEWERMRLHLEPAAQWEIGRDVIYRNNV